MSGLLTTTPIKHLVIIFQENVSFDHYFRTYPVAANPPAQPKFTAAANTPSVNGLSGYAMTHNPNQMITRIIVPFEGFPGRYVLHCHVLEHEDNEMMRPFEVIRG